MCKTLNRLFCLFVCVPPIYMLVRFVRWYIKQQAEPEEAQIES